MTDLEVATLENKSMLAEYVEGKSIETIAKERKCHVSVVKQQISEQQQQVVNNKIDPAAIEGLIQVFKGQEIPELKEMLDKLIYTSAIGLALQIQDVNMKFNCIDIQVKAKALTDLKKLIGENGTNSLDSLLGSLPNAEVKVLDEDL